MAKAVVGATAAVPAANRPALRKALRLSAYKVVEERAFQQEAVKASDLLATKAAAVATRSWMDLILG
jgi:hypothetical protein